MFCGNKLTLTLLGTTIRRIEYVGVEINNKVLTVLLKIFIMNSKCKIYNLISIILFTLLIPTYAKHGSGQNYQNIVYSIDLGIKPRSSR